MGASTSNLTPEELNELHEASKFDARDIQKLYKRFQKLDRAKRGTISSADLQLIPELSMNPMCHRIIALFDEDKTDSINFHRFVQTLAVFSDRTSPAAKLQLAFRCYDVDGDGVINENDLFHVLKMLVGCNWKTMLYDKYVPRLWLMQIVITMALSTSENSDRCWASKLSES